MDETIRTAAISPLCQRLIHDMNMRRCSRGERGTATFATWGAAPWPSGARVGWRLCRRQNSYLSANTQQALFSILATT